MINAELFGKRIAEAILNEPGPCFYPGRFRPPHKGHYAAAKELASRNYVQRVYIVISNKTVDGITPEDSLAIWNMYFQAEPNAKITVKISTKESPVVDIIDFLKKNTQITPVYVAVGDDETDDEGYGEGLQKEFGDRVRIIKVQEKAGEITAPHVRNLLSAGDYEGFVEAVPEAAFNKGAAPKIFKLIALETETNGPEKT